MWKQLFRERSTWYLLIAAACCLVYSFFSRRSERRALQKFASANGYRFQEGIDPLELNLYETSFFGRFDAARNVVRGVWKGINFVYFDHHKASGHGSKASTQTVVAFEIGPKEQERLPKATVDGWSVEKSSTHLFLWLNEDTEDEKEDSESDDGVRTSDRSNAGESSDRNSYQRYLNGFLGSAYAANRRALEQDDRG
jgi:hypothetical protein